jgi:hypothetical protein
MFNMFRYHQVDKESTYYHADLESIDEKICALIQERKQIGGENPGFPEKVLLQKWSERYGIYEELLHSLFNELQNEADFKPHIEPKGFRKFLSIMQGGEMEDSFVYVTHICQYENASVLSLTIDRSIDNRDENGRESADCKFIELELEIQGYDCRTDSGSGSGGQMIMDYIIFPALPDDFSERDLVFKKMERFPHKRFTGREITIHLNHNSE